MVSKVAWRYMQYDPDRFPAQDFKFVASSTLGVIAREYGVTQLVQLLQTLSNESPLYPLLVQAVIDNMSISNRESFLEQIKQAQQPDPQQQQLMQMDIQVKIATAEAQIALLQAQAAESQARAAKYTTEAQAVPVRLENDRIRAISANIKPGEQDDKEFERRAKVAELVLKEREIASKEAIVSQQMQESQGVNDAVLEDLAKKLGE